MDVMISSQLCDHSALGVKEVPQVLIACHIIMGLLNTWMSIFCIRHFTASVPLVGGRDV